MAEAPKPGEKKPDEKKPDAGHGKKEKSAADKAYEALTSNHWGITPIVWLPIMFFIVFTIGVYANPAILGYTIRGVVYLMPIWLPAIAIGAIPSLWMDYKQAQYISKQKYVLLEVKLPQDIRKSMFGMEAVLAGMYSKSGESTFIQTVLKGQLRPWFSLEIVSLEGKIHFYIWTRAFYRNMIESAIYAHFPDVEIIEAEDYSRLVDYNADKNSVWGCEYEKNKMEHYLPIRTYHDFNLYDPDVDKPEKHVDPLFAVIENMGSLGKGEQMWLQIIFQRVRDGKAWQESGIEEIKKRIDFAKVNNIQGNSPAINESIATIQRNTERVGFDVGMRGMYIADRDQFSPARLQTLLTVLTTQFTSNKLNGLKPTHGMTGFDYPWEDFRNKRQDKERHHLLDAYRRRSYFYKPHNKVHPMIMSSEELATLWHFPTRGIQTPTLERIPSKRANPPANIPV